MNKSDYSFEDITIIQNIIKDSLQFTLLKYYAQSTASDKTDGSIVTEADFEMQKNNGCRIKAIKNNKSKT